MKIEVLRLNHRIGRDPRISTHVALTARAFGASKIYYSGQKDSALENNVIRVVEDFGGPFDIEYVKDDIELVKNKKNFLIVHLTMYGLNFEDISLKLKNKNLFVIVGGEKVNSDFYKLADYNISVTSQPISEVSALGVFLHNLIHYKKFFLNAKKLIVGSEKGKVLKQIDT